MVLHVCRWLCFLPRTQHLNSTTDGRGGGATGKGVGKIQDHTVERVAFFSSRQLFEHVQRVFPAESYRERTQAFQRCVRAESSHSFQVVTVRFGNGLRSAYF